MLSKNHSNFSSFSKLCPKLRLTCLRRFQSSTSTTKELDPIVLDEIFHKNKTSAFLFKRSLGQRKSGLQDQQPSKDVDLSEIDKNLQNFKANIPVNFKYYLRNLSNLNSFKQLPYKFNENQIIPSDKERELQSILWDFNAPIRFSFGYGSGVFSQGKDNSKPSQIDLNFVVTYPSHWHSLNLSQYPDHYSFLKMFGSSTISKVQDLGAGVYFNPYVKNLGSNPNNLIKYGVSSMDNLISDLINWDSLYLSGRLHKPTLILRNSPNISLLQNLNLVNAIKLSLLLLNKTKVSELQLYEMIASLSYNGDPRMKVGGENPNKVRNIVVNQLDKFRKMYLPLIETYFSNRIDISRSEQESNGGELKFVIDLSRDFQNEIISELPLNFRRRLFAKYAGKYSNELAKDPISQHVLNSGSISGSSTVATFENLKFKDLQEISSADLESIPKSDYEFVPTALKKSSDFVDKISQSEDLNYNLNKTLQEIIFTPALVQSLKGILTAGFVKSFDYALEKRLKYNKSLK